MIVSCYRICVSLWLAIGYSYWNSSNGFEWVGFSSSISMWDCIENVTSEGIYVMQRAFKFVGAKRLLWLRKVDDDTTKKFMVQFY